MPTPSIPTLTIPFQLHLQQSRQVCYCSYFVEKFILLLILFYFNYVSLLAINISLLAIYIALLHNLGLVGLGQVSQVRGGEIKTTSSVRLVLYRFSSQFTHKFRIPSSQFTQVSNSFLVVYTSFEFLPRSLHKFPIYRALPCNFTFLP